MQTDRQTDMQTDWRADRQTDWHADRQTDWLTNWCILVVLYFVLSQSRGWAGKVQTGENWICKTEHKERSQPGPCKFM